MKLLNKKKKGQVSIYVVFLFTAMIIILITAFAAPMGVLINTKIYQAGEDILREANESIQNISDATIRNQIQASIDNAFAAQANNIEVNANLFQYSWILIIGLTALVVFLFTRRMVEFGGGYI